MLKFNTRELKYNSTDKAFRKHFNSVIQQNIPKADFSFTEVLNDLAMSRSTFQRMVQKHFNCSPIAYLKRKRLDKAKELLKEQEKSIGEVAHACGFNSVSYFNRAFKEQFQTTPSSIS